MDYLLTTYFPFHFLFVFPSFGPSVDYGLFVIQIVKFSLSTGQNRDFKTSLEGFGSYIKAGVDLSHDLNCPIV